MFWRKKTTYKLSLIRMITMKEQIDNYLVQMIYFTEYKLIKT
jgi:hypothetical protein